MPDTDFSVADHFVEAEGYLHAALFILIEDAALRTDDELVLLRVADPDPVVVVLEAAVFVDALHRGVVGLDEVLGVAREAAPAERSVAVVEEERSHDVFDVGGEDEAFEGVFAVLGDFLHAGIKYRAHEGVAVVEEVGSLRDEGLDELEVLLEGLVDEADEFVVVLGEEARSLFEADSLRAVASVVDGVAGGLVGEELDVLIVVERVLEKVDDVAFVGYRERLALGHCFLGPREGFGEVLRPLADPALVVARVDARRVDFGDYRGGAGYLGGLRLSSAHSAESGRNEEVSRKSLALGEVELLAARVEQRVIPCGPMYIQPPAVICP